PVTSRMRSASVDFPWSMWAMIEKLRMLREGAATSPLRMAIEQACELAASRQQQGLYLALLGHPQEPDGGTIDPNPGADAAENRDRLGDQRAAERRVEPVPDAIGDQAEQGRGDRDRHDRAHRARSVDAVQLATQDPALCHAHRDRA